MSPIAFTTPATVTSGTAATASYANTYIRDNISWMATDSPTCRAYNSADQTHSTTGAWQSVTLDSERFDNASVHSTSVNTDRFTIPTGGAGKYLIGGGLAWDIGTATGLRVVGMGINGIVIFGAVNMMPGSLVFTGQSCATSYTFSAADYTVLAGYQTAGGATIMRVQQNYAIEAWVSWYRT